LVITLARSTGVNAIEAQILSKVCEIRNEHPNMSWEVAFNIAEQEHSGLFQAASVRIDVQPSQEGAGPATLVQCARVATTASDEPPSSIMFLPAGTQRIRPLINGKPSAAEIELNIGHETLSILQRDLSQRLACNVRPHAGFNHRPGAAAFLPQEFFWRDDGIHLSVDWTGAGRKAIKDRDYSYFSPTFLLSPEGRIIGLPGNGEIGSLTNTPAFTGIRRIAASSMK
jgi:hypothetical protein